MENSNSTRIWKDAWKAGPREMNEQDCKEVYTLNTWGDEKKAEARRHLEDGFWVRFASTAIGHTLSHMVEMNGIEWAIAEYGENIQLRERKGWGWWYVRLI